MAQRVYIVHNSNCEPWDDHYEWVESIWATREMAVEHIERTLGMERQEWGGVLRNRWMRESFEYLTVVDFDLSDPEDAAECEEYQRDPRPIASQRADAWIEERSPFSSLGEWRPWHEDKDGDG